MAALRISSDYRLAQTEDLRLLRLELHQSRTRRPGDSIRSSTMPISRAPAGFINRQTIPLARPASTSRTAGNLLPNLRAPTKTKGRRTSLDPGSFSSERVSMLRSHRSSRLPRSKRPLVRRDRAADPDPAAAGYQSLPRRGLCNRLNYRPLLTNNIIASLGAAVFRPGNGFGDIQASHLLYSAFLTVTLTF